MYSAGFESIKDECTLCKKCSYYEERLNIVFGEGSEEAEILFVGDFPRGKDDLKGMPFTGREGEILRKLFILCDMDEEKYFLTNILKCRPADGEEPDDGRYDCCMEHLRSQVRHVKPKIIVCLGENAAKRMIDPSFDILKDRGNFIKKGKLFFLATYHPSETVDDENKRVKLLSDFQLLRETAQKGNLL